MSPEPRRLGKSKMTISGFAEHARRQSLPVMYPFAVKEEFASYFSNSFDARLLQPYRADSKLQDHMGQIPTRVPNSHRITRTRATAYRPKLMSANSRDGLRIAGTQQICEDNSIDAPGNIRFRSALMLHVEVLKALNSFRVIQRLSTHFLATSTMSSCDSSFSFRGLLGNALCSISKWSSSKNAKS